MPWLLAFPGLPWAEHSLGGLRGPPLPHTWRLLSFRASLGTCTGTSTPTSPLWGHDEAAVMLPVPAPSQPGQSQPQRNRPVHRGASWSGAPEHQVLPGPQKEGLPPPTLADRHLLGAGLPGPRTVSCRWLLSLHPKARPASGTSLHESGPSGGSLTSAAKGPLQGCSSSRGLSLSALCTGGASRMAAPGDRATQGRPRCGDGPSCARH